MTAEPDGPQLIVERAGGRERVALFDALNAEAAERADRESNAWIKALRLLTVDGRSLRDRFTFRGDSLWWFAELYLHKRGTVRDVFRTIAASAALIARDQPSAIDVVDASPMAGAILTHVAQHHGVEVRGAVRQPAKAQRLDVVTRGAVYAAESLAARLRPVRRPRMESTSPSVAAFVHTAFWHGMSPEQEGYVGPVLQAIADEVPPGRLALVGVGPRTNFRARRWWHRAAEFGDPHARHLAVMPVESLARWRDVQPSREIWRQRQAVQEALLGSESLRAAAVIDGCDVWPLLEADLVGVAWLQFPWSARSMDEAAAVLDRLHPRIVLTYAEAGGWGRALILEARRRGIPSVGLQHGFIYRHWLNYLHEPDEMAPSPGNPEDRGFPHPDLTLVYDGHAKSHLLQAGRFPGETVQVTGSPRLDELVASVARLKPDARARMRDLVGATATQQVVVLAAKFTQIRAVYPAIVAAFGALPDVRLVIKCHPAETPQPYEAPAAAAPNIVVVPASTDLAALLAIARLVITVNSTVAIDAMVLGIPALVVDLPNNLSPFVDRGAMAGVASGDEIVPSLRRLLYDEEHRKQLALAGRNFMAEYGITSDGQAAARSARAVLALAQNRAAAPPAPPRVAGATGAADVKG